MLLKHVILLAPSTDSNVQSGGTGALPPSNKIVSRQGVCEACQQPIRYSKQEP